MSTPHSTRTALFLFPLTVLLLVGSGCFGTATQVGNDIGDSLVQPTKTSVEALNHAKTVAAEAQVLANWNGELATDDVTIAWVLTGDTPLPTGAKEGPSFGCGDRIAYAKEHRAAATESPLNDAVVTLLNMGDKSHDGLYNALSGSKLEIEKILSPDGVTTEVWLTGTKSVGGACDEPRFAEQLTSTVGRFKTHYKIFLNGAEVGAE